MLQGSTSLSKTLNMEVLSDYFKDFYCVKGYSSWEEAGFPSALLKSQCNVIPRMIFLPYNKGCDKTNGYFPMSVVFWSGLVHKYISSGSH